MDAVIEGLLAGYGIAIPVGAVAVVIVGAAARHGPRAGMAAGAGAATADFLYAGVAAAAGAGAASFVGPAERPARVVAALVLVALAVAGLVRLRRRPATAAAVPAPPPAARRLYAGVLGLTLANPVTVVYFASLTVGLSDGVLDGPVDRVAFVLAAGLASLSWQWLLAAVGGLLHGRLTPAMERATTVVGSATVAALGVRMAMR